MSTLAKIFVAAGWLAISAISQAEDTMASKESIRQLLVISNVRAALDSMASQFDQYMDNAFKQALNGQTPTPEQKRIMDTTRTKMVAVMRQELNWDSLESMYIDVYHETLTQSEVDGMIAFYKTPAGQAVIKKLPAVMQRSMSAIQQRMPALIEKLQQATREAQMELQKSTEQPVAR